MSDNTTDLERLDHPKRKQTNWPLLIIMCLATYVLSSGPVLAASFWLREATGWDGFYASMWLYYPLLIFGHNNPLMYYIEWWVVDVFGTVGSG